jgi:predicted amidohydrolase
MATNLSTEQHGVLAAAQMLATMGDKDANFNAMEQVLRELPGASNRLVVFPEMASTGYWFGDVETLQSLAEPVPGGPTVERWCSLASQYETYFVAGLPEQEDSRIFNTAVLVGPREGVMAKYRKLHLWSEEKNLYTPGDLGIVVVDLPFCRLGIMICYDTWFPEQARIMRLMGADVFAIPSALVWNDTPAHVKHDYYMVNHVGIATAHLNQVHLALASQVGRFGDKWLFGSSMLVGPYGWLLTQPADDERPAVLSAEVDFMLGRQIRSWSAQDHFDHDRRTDVYGEYLGYSEL